MEQCSITFYRITECGYFSRGDESVAFGSSPGLLEDLRNWSAGKKLIETKVSEVDESDTQGNTYLFDIKEKSGTWLITTWNETPSVEGNVVSVQGNSNVGDATIHMNPIVEGSIPGYATYFWMIPSKSRFASIRFHHPQTAQKPFSAYLEKFLEAHGRHVVVGEPNEESDYPILGYVKNAGDDPAHYYPRFRTALIKNPGQKQFLLDNIDKITKVIRKEVLDLTHGDELTFWQKMLRQAGLSNPPTLPIKPRISFEVPFKPTSADINNLFQEWEEGGENKWDDFGIKLSGDQEIHWVSHTLARRRFDLAVERDNAEVVNSQSLIDALLTHRQQILALSSTTT